MAANQWPPKGTEYVNFYLQKSKLLPNLFDQQVLGKTDMIGRKGARIAQRAAGHLEDLDFTQQSDSFQLSKLQSPSSTLSSPSCSTPSSPASTSSTLSSSTCTNSDGSPPFTYTFNPHHPPASILSDPLSVSSYDYDPHDPCPSIGGNVFSHGNVLMAGAYNQVEHPNHFLCKRPYLPLSSRRDVLVFRTPVLKSNLDVTGMPVVKLIVSTSALDTDFTAKLIDEYPPSLSYPSGYAMQITHGIRRCRFRDSRTEAKLMTPGECVEITIELYPTSNLFVKGHRLRLDISSSNFPHFDINMNSGDEFENQRVIVATNR